MTIVYFSTKSKKTRKQRQKQKDAWDEYKKKYGLVENKVKTQQLVKPWSPEPFKVLRPGAEDYKECKSLNTGAHVAAKAPQKKYTGDQIVGLAVMHKSNIVPIFNAQAAKDVASMRRNNN